MRIIEFTKMGLKNFCCHTDPIEIEFKNKKLTMITGKNGAGKTAILQSIPYTLYGICEKGRGEDVLNDKAKKDCHTYVEFKDDKDNYRVDRYVKYTRKGNTVTLSKKINNKWDVTHKGHKEVLPEIERILMPHKLFTNTLLFSQKVKTFFTDLTDSEQKEIFRKILKLDNYVLYQKQASDELKEIGIRLMTTENNINTTTALINSNSEEIESLKIFKKQFEQEKEGTLRRLKKHINGLESNIKEIEERIESYNSKDLELKSNNINSEIKKIDYKLDSIKSEIDSKINEVENQSALKNSQMDNKFFSERENIQKEMKEKIITIENEYNNLTSNLNENLKKLQGEYNNLENKKHGLIGKLNGLEKSSLELSNSLKMKGSKCPTCHQVIDDNAESKIKQNLADINSEIENVENDAKNIDVEKIDLQIKINSLNDEIKDHYNLVMTKKKEIEIQENELITQLQGRLNSAKNKVNEILESHKKEIQLTIKEKEESLNKDKLNLTNEFNKISQLLFECDKLQEERQKLQNGVSSNKAILKNEEDKIFDESQIIRLTEKIKILKSELKTLESEKVKFEKLIKILQFWKVGFSASGIQSMLIDEAIPFMNRRASYYLDKISGGRYKVVFDTLKATKDAKEFRDKISVDVFDTFTHADKRVKFSGGQERVVDIATILTLSDLQSNIQNISFNLLLFDEIFDSLDDENISNVAGLLRQIVGDKWIGLISHRHIDQVEYDDMIKLY